MAELQERKEDYDKLKQKLERFEVIFSFEEIRFVII